MQKTEWPVASTGRAARKHGQQGERQRQPGDDEQGNRRRLGTDSGPRRERPCRAVKSHHRHQRQTPVGKVSTAEQLPGQLLPAERGDEGRNRRPDDPVTIQVRHRSRPSRQPAPRESALRPRKDRQVGHCVAGSRYRSGLAVRGHRHQMFEPPQCGLGQANSRCE